MRIIPLILVFLLLVPAASAMQVAVAPEQFWGNVTYTDKTPVPVGATIVVANQAGYEIGRYTVNAAGSYGVSDYKIGDRLMAYAYPGDRLYFYVDIEPAVNGFVYFQSGEIMEHNIMVGRPKAPQTPPPTTVAPTPAPTTIAPTPVPTTIAPTPTPTQTGFFTPLSMDQLEMIILGVFLALVLGTIVVFLLFYWVFKKHGLGEETDEERYRDR